MADHPSNSRFWFAGNDPPAERLRIINKYLSEFDARPIDTEIAFQQPMMQPQVVRKGYEVGQEEEGEEPDSQGRAMVLVSWMLHTSDGGRLDPEDLPTPPACDQVGPIFERFTAAWNAELRKETPSLWRALHSLIWRRFYFQIVPTSLITIGSIGIPVSMK